MAPRCCIPACGVRLARVCRGLPAGMSLSRLGAAVYVGHPGFSATTTYTITAHIG